jgi:hypothetical protein
MTDRQTTLKQVLLNIISKQAKSIDDILKRAKDRNIKLTESEVVEAITQLELTGKIHQNAEYKFEILNNFTAATGEEIQKDQSSKESEKSPENQGTEKDQNITLVENKIARIQKDQSPLKNERSPTTPSIEYSPKINSVITGVRKLICPNPNCKHESEYKPNLKQTAKPLKTEKRERRLCRFCGKKSDLKFWIPKLDQNSKESEKSPENQGIQKDQKINPGENKTTRIQKDQKPLASEKSPTRLRLDRTIFDWCKKSPQAEVLAGIHENLYQSNIAKKYKLGSSKLSRVINQLIKLNIIECYSHYPKFYKIIADLSLPETSSKDLVVLGFHRAIFHTPIILEPLQKREIGMWDHILGDAETHIMQNWTQYIYRNVGNWKIEVNTKQVIWTYDFKFQNCSDPESRIKELQTQIPFEFLTKKGLPMAMERTYYNEDDIHCVVDSGMDLNGIDLKGGPLRIVDPTTGKTQATWDQSEGKGKAELETTLHIFKRKNIDEPNQIDKLTQMIKELNQKVESKDTEISRLTQSLNSLTSEFTTFMKFLKGETPVNNSPVNLPPAYRDNIQ